MMCFIQKACQTWLANLPCKWKNVFHSLESLTSILTLTFSVIGPVISLQLAVL